MNTLQKFNITNLPKSEQNIQFNNLTFNFHPPFVHFNFELREEHIFRDPLDLLQNSQIIFNFQKDKSTIFITSRVYGIVGRRY